MTIAEALKGMSQEELDRAVGLLQALHSMDDVTYAITLAKGTRGFTPKRGSIRASTRAGTDRYDYVLRELVDVCRDTYGATRGVTGLKETNAYKAFEKGIPEVEELLHDLTKGNKTLIGAMLRHVYTHMVTERHMSLPMLLANTSHIPKYLDECFPGYYQSGLMHIVVQALKHVKTRHDHHNQSGSKANEG